MFVRFLCFFALLCAAGCLPDIVLGKPPGYAPPVGKSIAGAGQGTPLQAGAAKQLATFAGGNFWHLENRFRQVPGVSATVVGYTGGSLEKPRYAELSTESDSHAEVVVVEFDPRKVSYDALLDVFFKYHDPTTRDRQGTDAGPRYRSLIFAHSADQELAARTRIRQMQAETGKLILTEIRSISPFWLAEDDHQQHDEKYRIMPPPAPQWR